MKKKPKKILIIIVPIILLVTISSIGVYAYHRAKENNNGIPGSWAGTAEYLFNLRIADSKDESAVEKLLAVLDIRNYGHYTFEVKPYILNINYSLVEGWGPISEELMFEKSAILLALIDNINTIRWLIPDREIYTITVADLDSEYGNIKDFGQSIKNFKALLIKLNYYVNEEDNPIRMEIINVNNTGLSLIIINNTNERFLYGEPFSIERKENDRWFSLEYANECAFTMIGYTLKANERIERNYSWDYCYGKLPTGEYRIIKNFSHIRSNTENWDDSDLGKNYIISAEFSIN